jgi:hypothetical protein
MQNKRAETAIAGKQTEFRIGTAEIVRVQPNLRNYAG